MDMIKMGNFLAALRKEQGLTQTELGEKLGISNKTVSRWETGTYMPPVEMLQELSLLYGVTINELVSGERLAPEAYQKKAEENILAVLKSSAFTLKDKIAYFKKKWRKDHLWSFILAALIWGAVLFILIWQHIEGYIISSIAGILAIFLYGYLNNQMMAYVERNAYDNSASGEE